MREGPGGSSFRAARWLGVLVPLGTLVGAVRFELSSRPVLELVDDWVIFEGATLVGVLTTELTELTASLNLPLVRPFVLTECCVLAPLRCDSTLPSTWPPTGPERKKSAKSAVELLFVTIGSRACNFEVVFL